MPAISASILFTVAIALTMLLSGIFFGFALFATARILWGVCSWAIRVVQSRRRARFEAHIARVYDSMGDGVVGACS